jgi:hypothetical protein
MNMRSPIAKERAPSPLTESLLFAGLCLCSVGCIEPSCADGFESFSGACTEDGPCGGCDAREFCDESGAAAECRCEPGYEGNPCSFSEPPTLVADPGFALDRETSPWDDDGRGVGFETEARDLLDPGKATLPGSVVCSGGGVRQVIDMPSIRTGDPLVAEVTYRATDVHGVGVGFNRAWRRLPPADEWTTQSFCLGQAAHGLGGEGGPVAVRIAAAERAAPCAEEAGVIEVDRFSIRLARSRECLPLDADGVVLNGTAEPGAQDAPWPAGANWGFFTEPGATASFEPDVGRDATDGARLFRSEGSARATVTTQISVAAPSTVRHPALRFWWRGSIGALFEVNLGTRVDFDDRGRQLDTLVGSNSPTTFTYCLPPWAHGSVLDLSFSLPSEDVGETELIVDDVLLVDDASCGVSARVLDPGFDSRPNRWPGSRVSSLLESVTLEEEPNPEVGSNDALALKTEVGGANLAMETYVLVPAPDENGDPVVRFQSRAPAPLSSTAEWVLGFDEATTEPVRTETEWRTNTVCLPPLWEGRWYKLQVKLTTSADPNRVDAVFLDDFELDTTPECP